MKRYKVAIAGATGAVGREMMKVLDEREFPVSELVPLASERSEGQKLDWQNREVVVRRLKPDSFAGIFESILVKKAFTRRLLACSARGL